jgi:hypothetical protein
LPIRPLGRKPERIDPRSLHAERFLDLQRPAIGFDLSWHLRARGPIPYFTNDRRGSCTVAALAQSGRIASAAAGQQIVVPDSAVNEAYDAINGGVDEGAYMIDALRHVKAHGLGELRLLAYARIDLASSRAPEACAATVEISGSVYSGFALPRTAQGQSRLWDWPKGGPIGDGAPWSWGGHAISLTSRDPYTWSGPTWNRIQRMSTRFVHTYRGAGVGEAWLILWEQGLTSGGLTPSGYDPTDLMAAAAAIAKDGKVVS